MSGIGTSRTEFSSNYRKFDDAGITAPKLKWIEKHEPEVFNKIATGIVTKRLFTLFTDRRICE